MAAGSGLSKRLAKGSFGSHRVLLKDKQTTAAAERRATSNVPPELSAEGRIQQVSYRMVNDALALYCTHPRDSSNKCANASLTIQ